jgi:hypothetical protein
VIQPALRPTICVSPVYLGPWGIVYPQTNTAVGKYPRGLDAHKKAKDWDLLGRGISQQPPTLPSLLPPASHPSFRCSTFNDDVSLRKTFRSTHRRRHYRCHRIPGRARETSSYCRLLLLHRNHAWARTSLCPVRKRGLGLMRLPWR